MVAYGRWSLTRGQTTGGLNFGLFTYGNCVDLTLLSVLIETHSNNFSLLQVNLDWSKVILSKKSEGLW